MTFDHLALSVESISEALTFYRGQFPQIVVLHEDPTWAFVQIDSVKIAFVLEDQHPPHLAFRIDSREELERRALAANATVDVHRDRSESFYQDDPAGNAIEFVYYPAED